MNLQNLKRGGELRKSILAPPGHSIVVADSAQIEARVVAWLAGQHDIVQAFASGQDVYRMMGSAIFNKPADQISKDERFISKVCVLGLSYSMGPAKLQLTLKQGVMGPPVDLSFEECQRMVNIYRSRNYRIRNLWKIADGIIAAMLVGNEGTLGPLSYGKGYIRLPNGMFLQYYGLHGDLDENGDELVVRDASYLARSGKVRIFGPLLVENLTQALARCIIAEQILRVEDAGWRVVTTTHDEIVAIAPTKQADKCLKDMLKIMSTAPEWAPGLPLAAEGGHDINYSK